MWEELWWCLGLGVEKETFRFAVDCEVVGDLSAIGTDPGDV